MKIIETNGNATMYAFFKTNESTISEELTPYDISYYKNLVKTIAKKAVFKEYEILFKEQEKEFKNEKKKLTNFEKDEANESINTNNEKIRVSEENIRSLKESQEKQKTNIKESLKKLNATKSTMKEYK